MDPYLETPDLWPDVHHGLISQVQAALNPNLRPNYVARVELRVYISEEDDPGRAALVPDVRVETAARGRAQKGGAVAVLTIDEPIELPMLLDNEIEESYLTIRHRKTGALVTVIEVMSPTNKILGAEGRNSFLRKKREVLASDVNWVEIDLLRTGEPSVANSSVRECDYRVLVYRAKPHRRSRCWPIHIRRRMPVIGVPLRSPDPDVPLDLGAVLNAAYDNAAYDSSIEYSKPPDPPLRADDARWANKMLRAKGLR